MKDNLEGFEIELDRPFQERFWVVERVGWAIMLIIVVAALAGFAGVSGPASSGYSEAGGARIEHPRISRWRTADTLVVEFGERAAGKVEVLIPRAFTEIFSIEGVTPNPSKATATREGTLFEFELDPGPGSKTADFAVRATRPAFPTQARGAVAGEPFAMSFTVLP